MPPRNSVRRTPPISVDAAPVIERPVPDLDLWQQRQVKVPIYLMPDRVPMNRDEKVDGLVYGQIWVHPTVNGGKRWAVTAGTVGEIIVLVDEMEDALIIGEYLWGRHFRAFRETDRESIKAGLPQSVVDWLYRCNEARKWVP